MNFPNWYPEYRDLRNRKDSGYSLTPEQESRLSDLEFALYVESNQAQPIQGEDTEFILPPETTEEEVAAARGDVPPVTPETVRDVTKSAADGTPPQERAEPVPVPVDSAQSKDLGLEWTPDKESELRSLSSRADRGEVLPPELADRLDELEFLLQRLALERGVDIPDEFQKPDLPQPKDLSAAQRSKPQPDKPDSEKPWLPKESQDAVRDYYADMAAMPGAAKPDATPKSVDSPQPSSADGRSADSPQSEPKNEKLNRNRSGRSDAQELEYLEKKFKKRGLSGDEIRRMTELRREKRETDEAREQATKKGYYEYTGASADIAAAAARRNRDDEDGGLSADNPQPPTIDDKDTASVSVDRPKADQDSEDRKGLMTDEERELLEQMKASRNTLDDIREYMKKLVDEASKDDDGEPETMEVDTKFGQVAKEALPFLQKTRIGRMGDRLFRSLPKSAQDKVKSSLSGLFTKRVPVPGKGRIGKALGGAVGAAGGAGKGGAGGAAAAAGGASGAGGAAGAVIGRLGAVGAVATIVAGLLWKLGQAATDLVKEQEEYARRLSNVSAYQAAQIAQLDANRLMRDIQSGENTAGGSGEMIRNLDRFETAIRPITDLVTNVKNLIAGEVLAGVNAIVEPVGKLAEVVVAYLNAQNDGQGGYAPFGEWLQRVDDLERERTGKGAEFMKTVRNAHEKKL